MPRPPEVGGVHFSRRRFFSAAVLAILFAFSCTTVPQTKPPATTASETAVAPLPGPFDWSRAILYFVITDRFADGDRSNDAGVDVAAKGTFHGGDLAGLTQHLDEIASLGVNAIWITPVVKNIDGFVTGAGFPDWAYHGYWADDFTRTDPRFGSEDDLRAFVRAAHRRGIRVLLDVVYNHAGYASHYLTDPKTKGWIRSTEYGGCGTDDITTCVAGLPDWKTELPEVDEFLLNAQIGMAKRAGVDGFRLDTVKHIDHPFWKEHRAHTRAELGRDFFLLGEVWGGDPQVLDPWFVDDEMDAGFDFSFQGSALGWVQGRGRTIAFDRYLKSREKIRAGHYVSHFLSSHDVPTALWQLNGDKALLRLAAVLELTSVGIPMIYYGEEVGRVGGDWPDNRSDMPWGEKAIAPGAGKPRDEELRSFYSDLIAIRKRHPALSSVGHTAISTDGDLLLFQQKDASTGDLVIVAVNRAGEAVAKDIEVPAEWSTRDSVIDELTRERLAVSAGRIQINVPPRSARIITGGATP